MSSWLARRSYLQSQTRRYDRLWRRDPQHFSSADREFQLAYCCGHGLTPTMRVLDFGCGPVAAGLHFIRYLATFVKSLPALLANGGCLLASFYLSTEPPRRHTFKDWSYDRASLADVAADAGLGCAVLDDFIHPRPFVRAGHHMAVLRLFRPAAPRLTEIPEEDIPR